MPGAGEGGGGHQTPCLAQSVFRRLINYHRVGRHVARNHSVVESVNDAPSDVISLPHHVLPLAVCTDDVILSTSSCDCGDRK